MPGHGVKGRSGRRQKFAEFKPEAGAPELKADYDSVTAYISWIAKEQAAGNMDRADARELRDHAKAMITAMRARHSEREIEEMRDLVKRAEKATQRADALEVADRYALPTKNLS